MLDALELLPERLEAKLVLMGEFTRKDPGLEARMRTRRGWGRVEDEAEAMGRRGREAFERAFNWEREGKRLLELYDRLAEDRTSGRPSR
jgi:glycosyltransferase involved in cell wall biosynthesis